MKIRVTVHGADPGEWSVSPRGHGPAAHAFEDGGSHVIELGNLSAEITDVRVTVPGACSRCGREPKDPVHRWKSEDLGEA